MRPRTLFVVGVVVVVPISMIGLWHYGSRPPGGPPTNYKAEIERLAREAQGADANAPNGWDAFMAVMADVHNAITPVIERERKADEEARVAVPDLENWAQWEGALLKGTFIPTARDTRILGELTENLDRVELPARISALRQYAVFVRPADDRTGPWLAAQLINPNATGTSPDFTETDSIRQLGYVLLMATVQSAQAGRWDEAADRIEDMVFVSNILLSQPRSVTYLLGCSVRAMARDSAIRLVTQFDSVPASVVDRIDTMFREYPGPSIDHVLDGERLELVEMVDVFHAYMRTSPFGAIKLATWKLTGADRRDRELLDACSREIRESVPDGMGAVLATRAKWEDAAANQTTELARLVIGQASVHAVIARFYVETSTLDEVGLRVVLAIARYVAATGNVPQSLDVLVPEYLDAVPTDAWAPDRPVSYIPAETLRGITVYSVGQDGSDDHGEPEHAPKFGRGFDPSARIGDRVFVRPGMWDPVPYEE